MTSDLTTLLTYRKKSELMLMDIDTQSKKKENLYNMYLV